MAQKDLVKFVVVMSLAASGVCQTQTATAPGTPPASFERTDNSQTASSKVAIEKARAAAIYKRPMKAFQDAIAKGGVNLRVLALDGAVPVEGGVRLISEGRIIGAIGVSGDLSDNDAQSASAAAQELK